jgi:hypothetical protein
LKEGLPSESVQKTDMQTTVVKELEWFGKEWAKLVDTCHTINLTNCTAKADVEIDGVKLLENIPATGLLELEKFAAGLKELVATIPTLDPVKGFAADSNEGKGIYKAADAKRERTAKELYVLELSPATEKHPAQVSKESRDVVTGHVVTQEWSGMFTPSEKSAMLTRCEDLINAIKAAQARANNTEVTKVEIGAKAFSYILLGK